MKWSMPHFDHKGPICGMAAFKKHCSFGFWKASLIFEGDAKREREAMGHFGRITAVSGFSEAKRAETREKRLATSMKWLAEGKPLMWKYQLTKKSI